MSTNIISTKASEEAQYKALIDGLNAYLPSVASFDLDGATYARADLIGRLQSRIDAAEATKAAQAQWHNVVAAERALNAQVRLLRAALKRYLESKYGKNSPKLQQFGFTPVKAAKVKASVRAKGVALAKATRIARQTLGKVQKKDIKGNLPAATPAAAPAVQPSHVAAGNAGGGGNPNAGPSGNA